MKIKNVSKIKFIMVLFFKIQIFFSKLEIIKCNIVNLGKNLMCRVLEKRSMRICNESSPCKKI